MFRAGIGNPEVSDQPGLAQLRQRTEMLGDRVHSAQPIGAWSAL
jgi:hypothetical protein